MIGMLWVRRAFTGILYLTCAILWRMIYANFYFGNSKRMRFHMGSFYWILQFSKQIAHHPAKPFDGESRDRAMFISITKFVLRWVEGYMESVCPSGIHRFHCFVLMRWDLKENWHTKCSSKISDGCIEFRSAEFICPSDLWRSASMCVVQNEVSIVISTFAARMVLAVHFKSALSDRLGV